MHHRRVFEAGYLGPEANFQQAVSFAMEPRTGRIKIRREIYSLTVKLLSYGAKSDCMTICMMDFGEITEILVASCIERPQRSSPVGYRYEMCNFLANMLRGVRCTVVTAVVTRFSVEKQQDTVPMISPDLVP